MKKMYEGVGEPVPVREIENEPFSQDQFSRRSFHRVAFLFGLGGAAYLAWCIYNKRRETQSALQSQEKSVRISKVVEINDNGTRSNHHVEDADIHADSEVPETTTETKQIQKIVLHQHLRGYHSPSIAPFPLKLETFLRVANIGYEVDFSSSGDFKTTPWMTVDDEEFSEAHQCISKLEELFHLNLDSGAAPSRKIASRLVNVMLENHIYWAIALWRWVYDEGKSLPQIQPLTASGLPQILAEVSASVKRAAWYHGIGRLTQTKVVDLIIKDLGDLSAALGKHPYFLGDAPGEVDCGAFAMLSQMIWNMPGSPFTGAVKQYPNLVEFVLRMRDNYWPDWDKNRQSVGQEVIPGGVIMPGAEFLIERQLHSEEDSSQWDSKNPSTVTLTNVSSARTTKQNTTGKRIESPSKRQLDQPASTNEITHHQDKFSENLEQEDVNGTTNTNFQEQEETIKSEPTVDTINNNQKKKQSNEEIPSTNKFGVSLPKETSFEENSRMISSLADTPTHFHEVKQSQSKPHQLLSEQQNLQLQKQSQLQLRQQMSHHQHLILQQQQQQQQQQQNFGSFNLPQSQQRFNHHENIVSGMHPRNYSLNTTGNNMNNHNINLNHRINEIINRNQAISNLNNNCLSNSTLSQPHFVYSPAPSQHGNTLEGYSQDNNSFRSIGLSSHYGSGTFHPSSQSSFNAIPQVSTPQLYTQPSSGNFIGTVAYNNIPDNFAYGANHFYTEDVQLASPATGNIPIPQNAYNLPQQQLAQHNQTRVMHPLIGQQQASQMNF